MFVWFGNCIFYYYCRHCSAEQFIVLKKLIFFSNLFKKKLFHVNIVMSMNEITKYSTKFSVGIFFFRFLLYILWSGFRCSIRFLWLRVCVLQSKSLMILIKPRVSKILMNFHCMQSIVRSMLDVMWCVLCVWSYYVLRLWHFIIIIIISQLRLVLICPLASRHWIITS